jgi:hypothetical protein|tara:strand:+ start:183 stop:470 length:288 start_codon:yes stop_codon:yes gene_type:complete
VGSNKIFFFGPSKKSAARARSAQTRTHRFVNVQPFTMGPCFSLCESTPDVPDVIIPDPEVRGVPGALPARDVSDAITIPNRRAVVPIARVFVAFS